MNKKLISVIACLLIAVMVLWAAPINGYWDFFGVTAPGSPASGLGRLFFDASTGKVACLDSAGANCKFVYSASEVTNAFDKSVSNNIGAKYVDIGTQTSPANPAASTLRVFANSTSGKLACLDTSGVDCMPAGSGGSDLSDTTIVQLRDDFVVFASTVTGELGGWKTASSLGSPATTVNVANHPGILTLTTGATSGNAVFFARGLYDNDPQSIYGDFNTRTLWEIRWIFRLPTTVADETVRIGLCRANQCNEANDLAILRYDSATSANWRYVTSNGTATNTDSTVAVAAGTWYNMRIWSPAAGTISFSINGANELSNTTNIPTGDPMGPAMFIATNATGAKSIDIDFFYLKIPGYSR